MVSAIFIKGAEPVISVLLLMIILLAVVVFLLVKVLMKKDTLLQELNEKYHTSLRELHEKQTSSMNTINQTMILQSTLTSELKTTIICLLSGRQFSEPRSQQPTMFIGDR